MQHLTMPSKFHLIEKTRRSPVLALDWQDKSECEKWKSSTCPWGALNKACNYSAANRSDRIELDSFQMCITVPMWAGPFWSREDTVPIQHRANFRIGPNFCQSDQGHDARLMTSTIDDLAGQKVWSAVCSLSSSTVRFPTWLLSKSPL